MLVGMPQFELASADSVDKACALLEEAGAGARVFAGGTDLFVKMKQRRELPRLLINIKPIPGLADIVYGQDGLKIGALTTIDALEVSSAIDKHFPVIRQAARVLGTTQVRSAGTIGGNLANASPSAEFAPPLLVLGGSVRCVSRAGERIVPLEELFVSPGVTTLRTAELITEVLAPVQPAGARSAYLKHSLRKMDVAIASAAVRLIVEGDVCTEARIALGAVAPIPFRARQAEQMLKGARISKKLMEEAAQAAARESRPIDDFRAFADHRAKIVAALVRQLLERLAPNASLATSAGR